MSLYVSDKQVPERESMAVCGESRANERRGELRIRRFKHHHRQEKGEPESVQVSDLYNVSSGATVRGEAPDLISDKCGLLNKNTGLGY